ncbi:MAG: PIN domain-containing protein [Spirochaetales bacterium]|jgi:predicted nucleic acid-binding protein|nr:PIN domain-containing protein [Spirochaetales bacterium]
MKRILVDSSVWISYFRDETAHSKLDELIQNSQICTNDLILAELLPFLYVKNQHEIIDLMLELPKSDLSIGWKFIINLQISNLQNGINKVGISDLILVDHVLAHNLILYSEDKHFKLMQEHANFELFPFGG